MTAMGHFLHNSLSKSFKCDLWKLWAISITIPYHNHWNMTYDSYGPFPLQFLIKIIEIWPMAAMGHFHYNSVSKSLKYELWHLWAISFTNPYPNHWNMTYGSYWPFPLQFLIKIIEIWPMTTRIAENSMHGSQKTECVCPCQRFYIECVRAWVIRTSHCGPRFSLDSNQLVSGCVCSKWFEILVHPLLW